MTGGGLTVEEMAAAYAESESLRSMAAVVELETSLSCSTRRPTGDHTDRDLLDLRIRVHAVADALERDVDDVLKALGRASIREVMHGDASRLDGVFVALRDSETAKKPVESGC